MTSSMRSMISLENLPASFAGICAPIICGWYASSYMVCRMVGKRFSWSPVQTLQVYRSMQCGIMAALGIFTMGVLAGQGVSFSAQCTDSMLVQGIIQLFLYYFIVDLVIMFSLGHFRSDLLMHHGVALAGILGLVTNNLCPCSSASVAVTELISVFSGMEAMLPKPKERTRAEESIFYVIRSYRLMILVLVRPFLWHHVRLSSETALTSTQAATYLIPGTVLPLLDLVWSYKIAKSLFPSFIGRLFMAKESTSSPPGASLKKSS